MGHILAALVLLVDIYCIVSRFEAVFGVDFSYIHHIYSR